MKDQVDSLVSKGIPAARLDSTLSADETSKLYQKLEENKIRLLYVAPERLANEKFRARLTKIPLALLAIDEAHCISEWGHDFRPEYRNLRNIIHRIGKTPIIALTATATEKVGCIIPLNLN